MDHVVHPVVRVAVHVVHNGELMSDIWKMKVSLMQLQRLLLNILWMVVSRVKTKMVQLGLHEVAAMLRNSGVLLKLSRSLIQHSRSSHSPQTLRNWSTSSLGTLKNSN